MTKKIKRSNPQRVPLKKLEGKRLLSVEEAESLHKNFGLMERDPELYVWSEEDETFYPNHYGSNTTIRTHATTRPEGFYENI